MDGIKAGVPQARDAVVNKSQESPVTPGPGGKDDASGSGGSDSVTIGANLADHLKDNPLLEKLNALIAGALVISGAGTVLAGIRKGDREQVLSGSKQTMWGVYYGLNAIDTVFKTAMSITPGLRMIGGFINADLGLTKIYKDYKAEGKVDADSAIFHSSAASWGMRHLFLGAEGLAKSRWLTGLAEKGSAAVKGLVSQAPLMGVLGVALGLAGGALDVALGVRGIARGVKAGDKEKKILGGLDVGIGLAMGAGCLLTGLPGVAAVGLGTVGMGCRLWRTDKKFIKETWNQVKEKAHEIKESIKEHLPWHSPKAEKGP